MKNKIDINNHEEVQKEFNKLLKSLTMQKIENKENKALTKEDHIEIQEFLNEFRRNLFNLKKTTPLREQMRNLRISKDEK